MKRQQKFPFPFLQKKAKLQTKLFEDPSEAQNSG
jgi:hypothetical protein